MATDRYVVGIDGEGFGRDPHRYALLAYSNATGRLTDNVENWSRGLSTSECLAFITDLPRAARVYGYYLGYDWTKILADLPNRALYALFRPEVRATPGEGRGFSEVAWRHYRLHYLAGMMCIRNVRTRRTVTVWDVGKFFQSSFVDALRKWGVASDIDAIASMKNERSEFSRSESARIREYCLSECRALASLVEALNDAHTDAGLPLKRWHGPGSSASVALKQMGIDKRRGSAPPEVERAASFAFFGGRFENREIGVFEGPVYGYDIVSAYPAACETLPCLEHATWKHTTRERDVRSGHALVHYHLAGTEHDAWWGPLPVRLARGQIVYPRSGASGWVWADEYRAAKRLAPNVEFLEAWTLRTRCKCKPFARVREWFDERRRIGKDGRGIVLKLALNSIYGKLAQIIAGRFSSRIWAGLITSITRAKLLDAIVLDPEAVLCTATDGIYSLRPLALDIGTDLGQWEAKTTERITLVRPGIYWTDEVVRARGIGRSALPQAQRDAILSALDAGASEVRLPPVIRFGGAKAHVYSSGAVLKRTDRYGEWYEQPARISFDPRPKRGPEFALWDLPDVESAPYAPELRSLDAQLLERAELLAWGEG